jgi:cytochrome P450
MTDRATVDFDHHDSEWHAGRVGHWEELRRCPVAYNERYGGFWVVSGHEQVAAVSRDSDTFTSRHTREPEDGIRYLGIAGIPRASTIPTQGIAEVEGPVHHALRRVMNPYLVPQAVAGMVPLMEAATTWFLDEHIETGAMDLVLDLANPVPAILTMALVGLPLDGWQPYADLFHGTIAHRPGEPEFDRAVAGVPAMLARLAEVIADRREHPGDDLLSALIALEVDGRLLSDAELQGVLWNLIGGGLDTTTSLTALSLHHLDTHPDLRARLIAEPALLPSATEEFLRYFSVNETLTRTVTRDTSLAGQSLGRGDHLMLSWLSANRDEKVFDCPDEVVLDREVNPHLAFGVGAHRCIGMHLARTMFQVLLAAVLTRIPDYRVDHEATRFYAGNPELNGLVKLPATFTPGPRLGPLHRPF